MQAMRQGELAGMQAELPRKGLFAMPFMRRALAKQRQVVALEAQEILAAQEMVDSLPDGNDSSSAEAHTGRFVLAGAPGAAQKQRGGRASAKAARAEAGEDGGGEEEDAAAQAARLQEAGAAEARAAAAGGSVAPKRAVAAIKAAAAGKGASAGRAGAAAAAQAAAVGVAQHGRVPEKVCRLVSVGTSTVDIAGIAAQASGVKSAA